MGYREKYDEWLTSTYFDADTKAELKEIESNEKEIEDRFYKDLEFGTAGQTVRPPVTRRGKLAARCGTGFQSCQL